MHFLYFALKKTGAFLSSVSIRCFPERKPACLRAKNAPFSVAALQAHDSYRVT